MSRKAKFLICAAIAYPVLVHSSVILERPDTAVLTLGALAGFYGIFLCRDFKANGLRKGAVWAGLGGCLIFAALSREFSRYALYIPPALITGLVLFAFARTLAKGREPLITRFARMMTADDLSPEILVYTRRVTWMWTFLLSAVLVECLVLPVFASIEVWSFCTNILNYMIMAAFFVGEYLYRLYRFGRRYSLRHFVRTMNKATLK